MVNPSKIDYFSLIGQINDDFSSNGWADGYADFDSNEEEIIRQLYGKVLEEDLIEYVNMYLKGFEVGQDMSENCEEIYDEDGNMKDDYDPDSIFDYKDEIRKKILEMKCNGII